MSDPSNSFIPLSVPVIQGNEWAYVKECLDTGWVSSAGKFVDRFEQETSQFTGAKYAVACATGTAALHVALRIAGVAAGDEVIVPTVTFIASINSVRYVDAQPVFMDCDEYYNLDTGEDARLHPPGDRVQRRSHVQSTDQPPHRRGHAGARVRQRRVAR
jgi:perosamine synthetase